MVRETFVRQTRSKEKGRRRMQIGGCQFPTILLFFPWVIGDFVSSIGGTIDVCRLWRRVSGAFALEKLEIGMCIHCGNKICGCFITIYNTEFISLKDTLF